MNPFGMDDCLRQGWIPSERMIRFANGMGKGGRRAEVRGRRSDDDGRQGTEDLRKRLLSSYCKDL